MRLVLACVMALAVLGACQSASSGGGSSGPRPNVITAPEMEALADQSVFTARQAIRRLRPAWLRPRSSSLGGRHTPRVFRDGQEMGGLEQLEDIDARDIRELRYLSASDATN